MPSINVILKLVGHFVSSSKDREKRDIASKKKKKKDSCIKKKKKKKKKVQKNVFPRKTSQHCLNCTNL